MAEWLASGRATPEPEGLTIGELLNAFREHAERSYADSPKVIWNFMYALKPLRRLYGATPVSDFGPLKLKALIGEYGRMCWCRQNINRHIARAKAFFKWAVSNELAPGSVHHALLGGR